MELRPTTTTAPWRKVAKAERREGAWSMVISGCKGRWYELTLECGHVVERGARYNPTGPRGWGSMHHPPPLSHMLPPPRRVRCTRCAK
jgi:hypothetical protein